VISHPPPRPDFPPAPQGLPPPPPGVISDERPVSTWRWWEALGVVVLGYILGSMASIPVFLALGNTTVNGASGVSELTQTLVTDLVLVGVLVFWLQRSHPEWRAAIGFPPRRRWLREMAAGTGLGFVVRIVAAIASAIVLSILETTGGGAQTTLPTQVREGLSPWALVVFAIVAVIVAPVTEEFVFRGLIYRSLRDRHSLVLAGILSAVLFGLVHFVPDQPWRGVVALQVTMMITGFGLAMVYEYRKNLLANIAGHAFFNLLAVVVIATRVVK
jgi:membrane protease YdiL (CAAX protease family)